MNFSRASQIHGAAQRHHLPIHRRVKNQLEIKKTLHGLGCSLEKDPWMRQQSLAVYLFIWCTLEVNDNIVCGDMNVPDSLRWHGNPFVPFTIQNYFHDCVILPKTSGKQVFSTNLCHSWDIGKAKIRLRLFSIDTSGGWTWRNLSSMMLRLEFWCRLNSLDADWWRDEVQAKSGSGTTRERQRVRSVEHGTHLSHIHEGVSIAHKLQRKKIVRIESNIPCGCVKNICWWVY